MKEKLVLGLDLGIRSIGWALINETEKKIIDCNVSVLPQTERSATNADRRAKRLARRQNRRKKQRRRKVIQLLAKKGLLPISPPTQDTLHYWSQSKEKRPNPTPKQKEWGEFYRQDPWELLKKALEGKKLEKRELSRIFYHMAHRRGFPEELLKSIEDDKSAKILSFGDDKKVGAKDTKISIDRHEYPYLGHYLASIAPEKGAPFIEKERIRSRYTYRRMYKKNFDRVWETQEKHHPILKDPFKKELKHFLFYQLPIRIPLRGKCTFEPQKQRTLIAHPLFETFRLYKFINTIKLNFKLLSKEDHDKAVAFAEKKEENKKVNFTIEALKKELDKQNAYCNYKDKDEIPGRKSTALLKKIFGKATWKGWDEKTQQDRFHALYEHANNEKMLKRLGKKWGIKEKEDTKAWKALLENNFVKGTANLSEKAIRYMLPWVKDGYNEHEAALLGSVKKAFGHNYGQEDQKNPQKPNHWDNFFKEKQDKIAKDLEEIVKSARQSSKKAIEEVKKYLKENYPTKAYALDKIYHHSMPGPDKLEEELPLWKRTNNPTVDKILATLRKIVNTIKKEYGTIDAIHIELARDLKNSKKVRDEIENSNKQNKQERDKAYGELLRSNISPNSKNIRKYMLWKECRHFCVYSGNLISITELFSGSYEVEHIIPEKIKDSRWINLALCLREENNKKGDRTPFEAWGNTYEWEAIKQRAKKHLPRQKYERFIKEKRPEESLLPKDLDTTGYITKAAHTYLRKICKEISTPKGTTTSLLRKQWKLDRLLSTTIPIPKERNIQKEGLYYIAYIHPIPGGKYHNGQVQEGVLLPSKEILEMEIYTPSIPTIPLEKFEKEEKELNEELKKTDIEEEEKELEKKLEKVKKDIKDHKKNYKKEVNKTRETTKKQLKAKVKKEYPQTKKYDCIWCQVEQVGKDQDQDQEEPQYIAFPEKTKNRADHRHHVLDALVIATTTLTQQQEHSRASGQGATYSDLEKKYYYSPPWENFKQHAKEALEKVCVAVRQKNKALTKTKKKAIVPIYPDPIKNKQYKITTKDSKGLTAHGQLHNETLYGKYPAKDVKGKRIEGKYCYHHCNSIEEINESKAEKIVDNAIRKKVKEYLKDENAPLPHLPNKRGEPVPIKKVRIKEKSSKIIPLYGDSKNCYVDPQNNYIAAIYKKPDGTWQDHLYSLLDVLQHKKETGKLFPSEKDGNPLCFSLRTNDLVLLHTPSSFKLELDFDNPDKALLSPYLYRLQTFSQRIDDKGKVKPIDYVFRHHTAATIAFNLQKIKISSKNFQNAKPIKVKIDVLGRITKLIAPKENT